MSAIFLELIPTLYLRCLCTTRDLLFTRIYPQHMAPRDFLGIKPRIKPILQNQRIPPEHDCHPYFCILIHLYDIPLNTRINMAGKIQNLKNVAILQNHWLTGVHQSLHEIYNDMSVEVSGKGTIE
jgi:hypothetical protein